MRIISLLFASYLIVACAHAPIPSVPIEFGNRQTLYFTGKGAAAGMMMDAYLGGAGVAIGIAIDEGIAKDIAATIRKSSPEFDIRDLVQKQLVSIRSEFSAQNLQNIFIEKYGFQVVDGDFVSPVFELTVICKGDAKKIYFEKSPTNPYKAELDLVKKDGEVGVSLLQQALAETMQAKHLGALCGNRL